MENMLSLEDTIELEKLIDGTSVDINKIKNSKYSKKIWPGN